MACQPVLDGYRSDQFFFPYALRPQFDLFDAELRHCGRDREKSDIDSAARGRLYLLFGRQLDKIDDNIGIACTEFA